MPLAAYDEERELVDNRDRVRHGLAEAARLPALGDPAYLNTLGFGVDSRVDFRVTISTTGDQTAVAPGVLERQWESGGRRYFEYVVEKPIWPAVPLASARYTVARYLERGGHRGVPRRETPVERRDDDGHGRESLAYFSREFAPYPFSHFRIVEFPRYRTRPRAFLA